MRRLTNSIHGFQPDAAWGVSSPGSQPGHVEQPSPDPVNRTPAPVTTMNTSDHRATRVMRR